MKVRFLERLASAARGAISRAEKTRGKAYNVDIKRMLGHTLWCMKGVSLHGYKNKGQKAVMKDKNLQVLGDCQIKIGMTV